MALQIRTNRRVQFSFPVAMIDEIGSFELEERDLEREGTLHPPMTLKTT